MTLALWVLACAIVFLAVVIAAVAWAWANHSQLDSLTDEEVAARLAPVVAAELMVWSVEHEKEPEDPEPIG